jgi:hypothetical protein
MTEPQQLTIHLSGDAVVAPALRIIQQTVETVSFCLIAVDSGDMSKPAEFERARMQMRFSGDMSPDERRALYTNWLLSNGFQELARGIRATLDEALLYTEIFHLIESGKRTWGEFPEKVQEIRRRGTRAMFPDLMAAVNKGLSAPLHFEKEFLSLQKVRNCLEHRDGLVSDIDVDKETKTLKLSLPRFKMFYEKNDEEIELQVGTYIERMHQPIGPAKTR